jgi:lipoprotein-anchoring transpeptidase ErfK/SrfK
MVLRATSAVTFLLISLVLSCGQAMAQYYPPPPPGYPPPVYPPPVIVYPAQPYPPPYYRPVPPGLVEDDDDDVVVAVPPGIPAPRPPAVQYGARPIYPDDTYAVPPPAVVSPNVVPPPPGYGAVAPDDVIRPPMPIGPEQRGVLAALPPDYQPETGPAHALPPQFRRQIVDYRTKEPAGTIIIDTPHTYLYLVLGNGKAMRYGVGVGREGFTWAGTERISKMAQWPDWHPPPEMIDRQPYLPRFMAGGEGNPLGARALYLGKTEYRIHGTNQPSTIGTFVSSGCVRLTNEDVMDLYGRVQTGTRVVVLPGTPPETAQATAVPPPAGTAIETTPLPPPTRLR